jgi:arylsulfatase/uncharacterized sulfatase
MSVMSDIAPTLLDLAGVRDEAPDALAMTGRSLVPVLDGRSEYTYSADDAIGVETSGQAALYKGRYKLVRNLPPHGDSIWRLFDIASDPGETMDLSAELPSIKQDLMQAYRAYANRVGVLELPEGYQVELAIGRNMLGKLWQHYWGWVLVGLLLLIAALVGIAMAGRHLWRRLN